MGCSQSWPRCRRTERVWPNTTQTTCSSWRRAVTSWSPGSRRIKTGCRSVPSGRVFTRVDMTRSLATSLAHSHTHSLTHSLTHSPNHPLTHPPTHPLIHSLTQPPTHPLTHSLTHSLTGSQDSHFSQTIETAIAKLDSEDKEVIIIGDLNCNFLAARPDRNTENLKPIIEVYQMKQLISEPTRLTESSQTLIDVILTNKPNRIVSSGVLHVSISDHSLIYTVRKISVPTQNNHKYQSMRSFKKFNSDSFRNDLKNQSWNTLMINDPNEMWKAWKEMFISVADKHPPLKLKRIKNKSSPWITCKVKNLMNKRDNLKRVAVRKKNSQAWVNYKKARNSVNNAIKTTKAAYYNAQFDKHSGNPKETWKLIREIQGKTKKAVTIGHCELS